MIIRQEKVVANLPSKLTPSTIYYVRVETGFDIYVSDATGEVAHTLNLKGLTESKLLEDYNRGKSKVGQII